MIVNVIVEYGKKKKKRPQIVNIIENYDCIVLLCYFNSVNLLMVSSNQDYSMLTNNHLLFGYFTKFCVF